MKNFRTVLLALAGACVAPAYRPPEDRAGPLTVKIEGPVEITQTANPEQFTVVLESAASATVIAAPARGWRIRGRGDPAPCRRDGSHLVLAVLGTVAS